jgi:hypothetical protein
VILTPQGSCYYLPNGQQVFSDRTQAGVRLVAAGDCDINGLSEEGM